MAALTGGIGLGLSLFDSINRNRAAGRAADLASAGQQGLIDEARAAREEFRELSAPFLQAGQAGIDPLLQLLGIGGDGQPALLEEINPLVSFLRDQGFEQIQESAAGRGFTGGTLNELADFNTQLASTVVPQLQQQRFNQLFNLVGLGANTATGVGTAGLQSAQTIGQGLANIGNIQGQGAINRANVVGSGLSDLALLGGFGQGGGFNFLRG